MILLALFAAAVLVQSEHLTQTSLQQDKSIRKYSHFINQHPCQVCISNSHAAHVCPTKIRPSKTSKTNISAAQICSLQVRPG